MANGYYTAFTEGLLDGSINPSTASIKVALVRGYTFSAGHKHVSDATTAGATINGTSAALTGKTVTGGVFGAGDATIAATASASNHGLLLYQASAASGGADVAASAQRLIAYFDTGSGLPIQPGTGDVKVTWPTSGAKILKVG